MTQTMQIKDPKAPATPAQTSYLDSLVTQRELPAVCERYALLKGLNAVTKGQASSWINELLAAPKKTVKLAPASVHVAQAPAPVVDTPQLTELPSAGYYIQEDGTLLYWDTTGKDQYPTLRRLTIITNYDGSKKGKWSKVYGGYNGLKVTGTWVPYAGKGYIKEPVTKLVTIPKALVNVITAGIKPLNKDAASQISKEYGFCIRCGATLTAEESLAAGLGPVCRTYWGI